MTPPPDLAADWLRIASTPRRGSPALFLDRDGTVIENVPYLADPAGVRLIAGAREAIAAFRAAGHAVILVTNQSGVARGLCSADQYRAVEARVLEFLGPDAIDLVYACPCHPAGEGMFACDHPWRKPEAGMLLDAAERFGIDLSRSLMTGDSLSDIQAGAKAGVAALVHVATGHGAAERAAVAAFAENLARGPNAPLVRYVDTIGALAPAAWQEAKSSAVQLGPVTGAADIERADLG